MSMRALAWAFRVPIEGPAKGVLIALADHADDADGFCFPKIERIQQWSGYRARAVRGALQKLKAWGLLLVEGPDRYFVNVGAELDDDASRAAKPARHAKRQVHEAPKSMHEAQNKVHEAQPELHEAQRTIRMNPQLTPKENPQEPPAPAAPVARSARGQALMQFGLPPWMPQEVWDAYLAMRRRKRVPDTEYSLNLVIAELSRFRASGHDPVQVLHKSIRTGWTDVFAPDRPRLVSSNGAPKRPPTASENKWSHFSDDHGERPIEPLGGVVDGEVLERGWGP